MPGTSAPLEALLQPTTRFATAVSSGTGLSLAAVLAWMRAEGGPADNPLNIGPGRHYGTPEAAAQATIDLLHTKRYAGVLEAARASDDPKTQLAAIAESPWDTGKAGPKPSYLKLLLGSLAANASDPNNAAVAVSSGTDQSGGGGGSILDGLFSGMFGGLEKWIQNEAATGLAYVTLTILALALVLFGALDLLGYSPKRVVGAAIPSGSGVPF